VVLVCPDENVESPNAYELPTRVDSTMAASISYHRTTCRLCGSTNLESALPIAATPIGDAYVPAAKKDDPQTVHSLELYLCTDCAHLQLLDVVDPEILFGEYTFVTASSGGLVDHFRRHSEEVVRRASPAAGGLVVEIGSNDGSLLRFYQQRGMRVLGVDPAREIARRATESGVETLPTFFNREAAEKIRAQRGPAVLVEANNVYAHADDLAGITDGVAELLAPDGVFVFEVSYLVDTLEKKLFDTVYHEHVSYHSVAPLVKFFLAHGLELFDIERIATKGGSIRGYVQPVGGPKRRMPIVDELVELERKLQLDRVETFRAFAAELSGIRDRLHQVLRDIRAKGGRIAGFGASVTVTTLIYHFGLGEFLDYLVDDNPSKHGLFSPGLHLPVVSSDALYEKKPAATVILAWQYAEPILKKHARYAAEGGRFIVPLPEVRVVGAS
jgi:SAM-dependent methyltransferase